MCFHASATAEGLNTRPLNIAGGRSDHRGAELVWLRHRFPCRFGGRVSQAGRLKDRVEPGRSKGGRPLASRKLSRIAKRLEAAVILTAASGILDALLSRLPVSFREIAGGFSPIS